MDLAKLRSLAPSASDAHRIESSYRRIEAHLDRLAPVFFTLVERSSPVWASVLPQSASERRARLAACLAGIATQAGSEIVLGSLIFRIGAGRAGATATQLNLGHLASALLESLSQFDPEWDESIRNAWLRLCAWAAWCLRSGHDERQRGRVRADDAIDLDVARRTACAPTLVSAA